MRLVIIIGLFFLTNVPAWATEEENLSSSTTEEGSQKKTFAEQTAVTKEDIAKLKTQITDYKPKNK